MALAVTSTGQSVEVLAACSGRDCEYAAARSSRWVWSDSSYTEFAVPVLSAVEWLADGWGACCCPSAAAGAVTCSPGTRKRSVACSVADEALCTRLLGPSPPDTDICQDFSGCPYEPFCPLGRGKKVDCNQQAWGLLGLILIMVVAAGTACRYCRTRWFNCYVCRPLQVVVPKVHRESAPDARAGANGSLPPGGLTSLRVEEASAAPAGGHLGESSGTWSDSNNTPLEEADDTDFRFHMARMLGTWFYEKTGRYCISRTAGGQLRFDEQLSSGQWVFGVLETQGEWLQGKIRLRNGVREHGTMRMRYIREKDIVVSNFQIVGESSWGTDRVASKVDPTLAFRTAALPGLEVTSTKLNGDWDVSATPTSAARRGSTPAAAATAAAGGSRRLSLLFCMPQALGGSRGGGGLCGGGTGVEVDAIALASEEAQPLELMSTTMPGASLLGNALQEPPQKLLVVTGSQQASCAGEYDLVRDERPNGSPVWKKRGGDRWMYTGTDGKWYIGGPASKHRAFDCASGFIFRDARHGGVTPDRIGGPWERGDGSLWHPDSNIVVTTGQVFSQEQLELAAALELASDILRVQEDGPGLYVITHDNAAVTTDLVPSPPVVDRLPAGTVVMVKEVVHRAEEQRVRARIENPPGWISLRDLKDGYRWARKEHQAASDSSTRGETLSTSSSSRTWPSPSPAFAPGAAATGQALQR